MNCTQRMLPAVTWAWLLAGTLAWAADTNAPADTKSDNPAKPRDYRMLLQRVRAKQQEKSSLDELQKAVSTFQLHFGRLPSALSELVERGILPELPAPPRDTRFFYDQIVGNVRLVPVPGTGGGARTNLPGSASLLTQPK